MQWDCDPRTNSAACTLNIAMLEQTLNQKLPLETGNLSQAILCMADNKVKRGNVFYFQMLSYHLQFSH